MTAKACLCQHLLLGESLSVMDSFRQIGFTNLAREIPRMVEKPFGVTVSRSPQVAKNRFGMTVNYMLYRLNPLLPGNAEGIDKMIAYVKTQATNNGTTTNHN